MSGTTFDKTMNNSDDANMDDTTDYLNDDNLFISFNSFNNDDTFNQQKQKNVKH